MIDTLRTPEQRLTAALQNMAHTVTNELDTIYAALRFFARHSTDDDAEAARETLAALQEAQKAWSEAGQTFLEERVRAARQEG